MCAIIIAEKNLLCVIHRKEVFHMAKKTKNKSKSIRQTRIVTEICIATVAIVSAVYVLKVTYDHTEAVPASPFIEISAPEDTTEPVPEDPDKIIYESVEYPTAKKFEGELILVNNDTEYYGFNEELVSVTAKINEEQRKGFAGSDDSVQLRPAFYNALADMLERFSTEKQIDDVVILDGYRTTEEQQALYDADLAETGLETSERVAKAGFSEHQTGYACDLTTATTWDYDGQGDYAWIDEHCWEYGIILRYPKDKTAVTQIQYEPWHYRYVGIPHAYYMSQNNLTLEEYTELLRTTFPYESQHLEIQYDADNKCEVYFVKSDDSNENTYIPVPSGKKYTISGNNSDGFIVTVYLEGDGQSPAPTSAPTEPETSESETTNIEE